MSFRDSAGIKPADCTRPDRRTTDLDAGVCVTLAPDGRTPNPGTSSTSPQGARPGSREIFEGACSSGNAVSFKAEATDARKILPPDPALTVGDAFSDAGTVRSVGKKSASLSYGSVRSSCRAASHHSNRIIYPSAPITFTKTLSAGQQWGTYTRSAGYLNAEAVRAAAAADESNARSHVTEPSGLDEIISPAREGDRGNADGSNAVSRQERERNPSEILSAGAILGERSSAYHGGAVSSSKTQIPLRSAAGVAEYADICGMRDYAAPGSRGINLRGSLGSWIRGAGERRTEIERLLKEERDLAEAHAAKSELAERKLVQEDMEAMIENLQQVKSFLVTKLRECETALLTTAQERDGLEATLQHIQSVIQDSVAENHRLLEDCKAQLAEKRVETEALTDKLEKATKEAERLRKENETLRNEVAVARAEVADVVAARGFRIEEYQAAVQTLMDRNKTQHRELKGLRVQLIKTREEYANALARIDELESLADFHKTTIQDSPPTPPHREHSPWRIPGVLQRGRRTPQDASPQPSDAPSSVSSYKRDSRSDRNHENTAHDSDPDGTRVSPEANPKTRLRGTSDLCSSTDSWPGGISEPHATTGPSRAGSLGSSVTGLLASGVSRVLQHFEQAAATDKELQDSAELDQEDVSDPPGSARLHEEAALFVQRTAGHSDIVVQLEEESDAHQSDGRREGEARGMETSTLGGVARTVWQAAHEMLADRALPPARLSTLRTIAASNPSAWEVIRERHRAAKSMPLFSSIPPAVYPLIAEGKREGRDVSTNEARSAATSSSRNGWLHFSENVRRNIRQPPAAGVLNARPTNRSEGANRVSQRSPPLTVELHSELAVGATGEVVVWQEEVIGAPGSPSSPVPEEANASDAERPSIELDSSRPGTSTSEVDKYKAEGGTEPAEGEAAAVEPGTPVDEPEPFGEADSGEGPFSTVSVEGGD